MTDTQHTHVSIPQKKKMAAIISGVAFKEGISVQQIKSRSRKRRFAWPRQDAMLACSRAGYSSTQIGRVLDRDHTTVLHGIQAAEARE